MGSKKKPNFPGVPTQESALEDFTPSGFYSPFGNVAFSDNAYRLSLDSPYNDTQGLEDYKVIRNRLMGDIGLTGEARADQIDQYGQTYFDQSRKYTQPALEASLFGRGLANSKIGAEAVNDLLTKTADQAVLSREQLRQLDEQLKLQQLSAAESGLTNTTNRMLGPAQFLMGGAQQSNQAQQQAVDQAQRQFENLVAIESERMSRANQAPPWLAPAAVASAFIPGIGPIVSGGLSAYGSTFDNGQGYLPMLQNNMGQIFPGAGGGAGTPIPGQAQGGGGFGGFGAFGTPPFVSGSGGASGFSDFDLMQMVGALGGGGF